MLTHFLLVTILFVIIALCLYGIHEYQYLMNVKEDFASQKTFTQGSTGQHKDYFYQFLPDISHSIRKEIENELNTAPNTHGDDIKNFGNALEENKSVQTEYQDPKRNLIMTSTKLAIFLGVENEFNIQTNFAYNAFSKTSSGKTRLEFVNHLIRTYFQNFMVVNALRAYNSGNLPIFSVISHTSKDVLDDDSVVNEATLCMYILQAYAKENSGLEIEEIPSFSMSRVYQSTQDRLEAKASYIFLLMRQVDIAQPNYLRTHTSEMAKLAMNEETKEALKTKAQALEQVASYRHPFLVALCRALIETRRKTPASSTRRTSSGSLIPFASRSGVSSDTVASNQVVGVNTLGSGYVPNVLTLLGDKETSSFKQRVRNAFAIMLKRVKAQSAIHATKCSTHLNMGLNDGHQSCTVFTPDKDDSDLVEELVYYIFGLYKYNRTKKMIANELMDLKSLSQNQTDGLGKDFQNMGLFQTDELIQLNNVDHRMNFIGPYTAVLRMCISSLKGISGNATLREDLLLFTRDL